jgi:hypothetical protein
MNIYHVLRTDPSAAKDAEWIKDIIPGDTGTDGV